MIEVTERAKKELKGILSAKVDNPQAGLRLMANSQSQLSLHIDVEMTGDQVVKHKGSKVLLVENELANTLEGQTLDFTDTAEGREFVFIKES
jgi:Fe-S cluster assembly iron-binding protein IscA